MAKQDDKTIEEILNDMEFRTKVFKYAKIGVFVSVMGFLLYAKGCSRGCSYGYGLALNDIKTTFPEVYNGLVEAVMVAK